MTPDEQGETARVALLAVATQTQDTWRLFLELLGGMVAEAVRRGWPEPVARALVAQQFLPVGMFGPQNGDAGGR